MLCKQFQLPVSLNYLEKSFFFSIIFLINLLENQFFVYFATKLKNRHIFLLQNITEFQLISYVRNVSVPDYGLYIIRVIENCHKSVSQLSCNEVTRQRWFIHIHEKDTFNFITTTKKPSIWEMRMAEYYPISDPCTKYLLFLRNWTIAGVLL